MRTGGQGGGDLRQGNRRDGMRWCWYHFSMERRGDREGWYPHRLRDGVWRRVATGRPHTRLEGPMRIQAAERRPTRWSGVEVASLRPVTTRWRGGMERQGGVRQGYRQVMAGRQQMKVGKGSHCRAEGAACSQWCCVLMDTDSWPISRLGSCPHIN